MSLLRAAVALLLASLAHGAVPSFPLLNAAQQGLTIPAIGIGTGGYGFKPAVGWGGYPECFDDASGCDEYSIRTVVEWIKMGGRRLDLANTYGNTRSVGRAIQQAGVPRKELFLLEKVGPAPGDISLGYNDTLIQFEQILRDLGTEYVDLLLIHWPNQEVPQSIDPYCRQGVPTSDPTKCRLSTWRAMLEIFDSGRARAVGVSNFDVSHLQEIIEAGLRLPSYNQCPFHLYRSSSQQQLRDFCTAHNITFGGYSPLGVPDWQIFPTNGTGMAWTPMEDPIVTAIAAAHGRTAAQVLLQWQYALGVPTNPRSQNVHHMRDNLLSFDFKLTADEIKQLNSAEQDRCVNDPDFYECTKATKAEIEAQRASMRRTTRVRARAMLQ